MTKTTVSGFGGKALRCTLAAATAIAFAPTVAFATGEDGSEDDSATTATTVYKQSDGYEPYQGWQDGQWDEATDPQYSSQGGTSRKGWPAWSLSDPLSIGVTDYDGSSLITGSGVKVVTDTNACDTEGEASYKDPWYYKNVILDPYDVTDKSTISFTFNTVNPGGSGVAADQVLSLGGFAVTTSAVSSTWSGEDSTVVWSATTSDLSISQVRDNWWQRMTVTVPTENLKADQTYYFVIKNGTAGGWGRIYADIVFEFSTGSESATWEGDLSAAGYGREQGNGGTKLGITSPDPADITTDLTVLDSCWRNVANTPLTLGENGSATFTFHADGSGSNWQNMSTWSGQIGMINIYDADPTASGAFSVNGMEPIASSSKGNLSLSLVNDERDWPTRDGLNISVTGLENGKTYYLVFDSSLKPATTNALGKPIVLEFETASPVVATWDCGAENESDVKATLTENGTLTLSGEGAAKSYASADEAPWYEEHASDIKNVVIAEGVTSIGANALSLPNLQTVKGSSTLSSIGAAAFAGASNLIALDFSSCTLTSVGVDAFGAAAAATMLNDSSEEINRTIYVKDATSAGLVKAACTGGTADTTAVVVLNGGKIAKNTTFESGVLVTPLKADYEFKGWYEDEACATTASGWMPVSETTLFAGWKLPDTPVDKSVLSDAIDSAEVDLANVEVSVDGADVSSFAEWVSQSVYDSFAAAIDDAKAVLADDAVAQYAVDAAATKLASASETFAAAKKPGTKSVAVVMEWEIGKDNAADVKATLYDDGSLIFSGSGDISSNAYNKWTAAAYRDQIKSAKFEEGVAPTNLFYFFRNCSNLTKVSALPDSCTSLFKTFGGCTSLTKSPAIPKNVTAMNYTFEGCSALKTAPKLPSKVSDFTGTFSGCTSLTEAPVILGSPRFMDYMFSGCTSLTKAPAIPAGVEGIQGLFRNCTSLVEAPELPAGVGGLVYTFQNCTSLKKAPTIPASVWTMTSTFEGCTSLTEAPVLPEGVGSLDSTFKGCTSLTKAPELVVGTIGQNASFSLKSTFEGCTSLKEAPEIPHHERAWNLTNAFKGCTALTSAPVIPAGSTLTSTFEGCTSLTEAPVIPEGTKAMTSTFKGCVNLAEAPAIPDTVTNMSEAFSGCVSLTNLPSIPDSVTNLNKAFENCTSITALPVGFSVAASATITDMFKVGDPYSADNLLETTAEAPVTTALRTFDWTVWNRKLVVNESAESVAASWEIGSSDPSAVVAKLYKNGVLMIAGEGNTKAYADVSAVPWLSSEYKDTITFVMFDGNLAIEDMSNYFNGAANLVKMDPLPTSVTKLDNTFAGCESLKTAPKIPTGVTSMAGAFRDCKIITSAPALPSGITSLAGTFAGCESITSMPTVPAGVTDMSYAFDGCTLLSTTTTLPAVLETMAGTFRNCTSIVNVPEIPGTVTNMESAFEGCSKLMKLPLVPSGVTNLNFAFAGCPEIMVIPEDFDIPAGAQTNGMFKVGDPYSADNLLETPAFMTATQSVTDYAWGQDNRQLVKKEKGQLPREVWQVGTTNAADALATLYYDGKLVFSGKGDINQANRPWTNSTYIKDIVAVEFDEGVEPTNLGYFFQNCTNLVEVGALPSSVKAMTGTFWGCTSLKSAPVIPDGVTSLYAAFRDCKSLTEAPAIPASVNDLGQAFLNCELITEAPALPENISALMNTFSGCKALKSAPLIPAGVTNMQSTFANCTSLVEAPVIPSKVTNMQNTFLNCTSLKVAPVIPDSVTVMWNTFNGCTALEVAPLIPEKVTNLQRAFYNCVSLTTLPEGFSIPDGATKNMSMMFTVGNPYNADNLLITTTTSADANLAAYNWAGDFRQLVRLADSKQLAELKASVRSANKQVMNTVESEDGSGLDSDTLWVTPDVMCDLENAIEAAQKILDSSAALRSDAESAAEALAAAVERFVPAPGVDATDTAVTQLSLAADIAECAMRGVKESADGSDIYAGVLWVTPEVSNALREAVTSAKTVAEASNPKAVAVAAASEALAKALAAYKPVEGTKSLPSSGGSTIVVVPDQPEASDESKAAAAAAVKVIDAIGTVTLDSKDAIEAARAAYDALTDEQKELVPVEKLVNLAVAEATYAMLASQGSTDPTPVDPAPVDPVVETVTVSGVTYTVIDGAAEVTKVAKSTKTVSLPSSVSVNGKAYKVTAVAPKAFEGCAKLTSVTIGKNVKAVGASAFKGCAKLKTVKVKSTKLTKAGVKNALKGSKVTTVKVPKSKLAAYKKIFTKANCGKKVKVVKA